MNRRRLAILLTWGLLGLVLVGTWLLVRPVDTARAASLTVCTEGLPTCDYAVIQDAVDAATPGDVVKVASGVYTGVHIYSSPSGHRSPSVVTQVVYISKTITVQGGFTTTNWITPDLEANPTTLDAQGQGRVFYITGDISVTIEGLNITGGEGSGLRVRYATISLRRNKVYGNVSGWSGGGLYVERGTAVLLDNSFTGNTA